MEIRIARGSGFCSGVRRAVELAFQAAAARAGRVATLGPLVHNPGVVAALREAGVEVVDALSPEFDTVIIRAHGVPRQLYAEIERSGVAHIDATCPHVREVHRAVEGLHAEGYQVLILGDAMHPEVRGILSYAGEDAVVVGRPDQPGKLKDRVGVVAQTTQPIEALRRLLDGVVGRVKELKVYNTVCRSTTLRLRSTEAVARRADIMIVVGGRNSANTRQLRLHCQRLGGVTRHIETVEELRAEWFRDAARIGVTAGASSPPRLIDEVVRRIRALCAIPPGPPGVVAQGAAGGPDRRPARPGAFSSP